VALTSGDLAILTQEQPHHLCDHPGRPVTPMEQVLTSSLVSSEENPGQNETRTTMVLGNFHLDHPGSGLLFSSLPALIHIKGEKGEPIPWLKDLLRVITRESVSTQSGSQAILNQLVHILIIQAIRDYVTARPETYGNRASAFFDPEIGPILRLMHHHPEKNWTVAALAEKACMSRSAFAASFTALVGQPPLSYLFLCRMNKACHLLRDPLKGIKEIAPRVGYASEAAFSNAFKRWAGTAPGSYRFNMQRR
jgi:AraC-like DNA-binding protein